MSATAMPLHRLVHPHAIARSLTDAGVVTAQEATPAAVRAWPHGRDGFIVLLRGGDGSRWGAARFGSEGPPANVLAGCGRGDVWPLAATGTFIWRHEADPALALRRALAFKAAGEMASSGQRDCLHRRVEVLSYKPLQRSVLRFQRAEGPALIAKLYGGQRDEQTASAHAGLVELSPLSHTMIHVLHPVSRIRQWRALLWHAMDGATLHAQLARPWAGRLASLAGIALASLHTGTATWTRVHRREEELAGIENWVRLAARVWPERQDRLLRALDGLRRRSASLDAGRLLPSHRDFHDKQLLVNDGCAAILDLDLACLAEPELDLGNFLAHLRLRALQGLLTAGGSMPRAFLDGYVATNGRVEPERIAFYECCARLRLACVYALRPRWAWLVPRLIEDADGVGGGHDT